MNDFLDEHFKRLYQGNMREVFYDPIQFKLYVAESILKQIPNTVPLKNNIESLTLEQNIEFFLFMIMSVQDIGLHEVNQVLNITSEKQFQRLFFKNLETSKNTKAKLIDQELKKSFNRSHLRRLLDRVAVKVAVK